MNEYLKYFYHQVIEGLGLGRRFVRSRKFKKFDKILFWGVGGSAMSGDILRVIASDRSRLLFKVYRDTRWPKWVDRKTLVIFSSYSGNSKEVLDAIAASPLPNANLLAVTSGGGLELMARRRKFPLLLVPAGIPPRCALGYLAFALAPVIEKIGRFKIADSEILELIKVLKQNVRPEALKIARQLSGRSIYLYGVSGFMEPAVLRWRAQLAENAKSLSSHYLLPEMFHNEIEGWQCPATLVKRSTAVFLKDSDDAGVLAKKRKAVIQHLRRAGSRVLEVPSRGKYRLTRLFSLVALGDWVSYELSRLNHVNSLTIPTIDAVKKIK